MSATYKIKWFGFFEWVLLLLMMLPGSAWAGQIAAKKAAVLEDWGFVLVILAMGLGAFTARFIPTAVDAQIQNVDTAKLVIGLSFGGCSTIALAQNYQQLSELELVFPAYLLAAIGTPVMVYAISIASDAETYTALIGWIKRRLGIEK